MAIALWAEFAVLTAIFYQQVICVFMV